jgi:serine protease AprX
VLANYPNPFSKTTTITLTLVRSSRVTIAILDLLGRVVASPVAASLGTGRHTIRLDDLQLDPGTYFCRVRAGELVTMHPMTIER